MKIFHAFSVSLLLLMLCIPNAKAALIYELSVSGVPSSTLSAWTLLFADTDRDMEVSFDEVTFFSGLVTTETFGTILWDSLIEIPEIPGIANGDGGGWGFASSSTPDIGLSIDYGGTSVFSIQLVSSVPTPATLVLFGLGLAGLGWKERKKKLERNPLT